MLHIVFSKAHFLLTQTVAAFFLKNNHIRQEILYKMITSPHSEISTNSLQQSLQYIEETNVTTFWLAGISCCLSVWNLKSHRTLACWFFFYPPLVVSPIGTWETDVPIHYPSHLVVSFSVCCPIYSMSTCPLLINMSFSLNTWRMALVICLLFQIYTPSTVATLYNFLNRRISLSIQDHPSMAESFWRKDGEGFTTPSKTMWPNSFTI